MTFDDLFFRLDGRCERKHFWLGLLGVVVIGFVLALLFRVPEGRLCTTDGASLLGRVYFGAGLAALAVLALMLLAVLCKRLHARRRSGLLAFLLVAPLVGDLVLGVLEIGGACADLQSPRRLGLTGFGALIGLWFLVDLGLMPTRGADGADEAAPRS